MIFLALKHPKVVGIGEFGLDDTKPRSNQDVVFKQHIKLALKTEKPMILHLRGPNAQGKYKKICTLSKVIKEKWGQYFKINHFCTPLCSKRSANIVIKNFLEQKFAKSSVINLIPNA